MSDVLFVYGDPKGPHPSHAEFIKAINADTLHVYFGEWGGRFKRGYLALKHALKYPEYKYYILESFVPVFPFYIFKKNKNKRAKIIGFFCDTAVMEFAMNIGLYSKIDVLVHKLSSKCLDAGISVSPMVRDIATKVLHIPIEVARPYITEENYIKLSKIKPDLESKTVAIVGFARKNHGADILLKAFKIFTSKNNNFKLIIGGEGWPKEWQSKNVIVPGYLIDLSDLFKKISVFVYPARGAAYPVITLEAMRAGVPVIVSKYTGTKELAEIVAKKYKDEFKHDARLVVDPTPESVAKSLEWYFSLSVDERSFLSDEFRKLSKRFNPKKCSEDFKLAFEKIKQKLDEMS